MLKEMRASLWSQPVFRTDKGSSMLPLVNEVTSGALGPVAFKASCLAAQELKDLRDVEAGISNLAERLEWIHSVLEDMDVAQDISNCMGLWLRQLKGIAYGMDDILDDFAAEAVLRPDNFGEKTDQGALVQKTRQACNGFCLARDCCLSRCFFNQTQVSFCRKLTDNIKSIKRRLDTSDRHMMYLNLKGLGGEIQLQRPWLGPESTTEKNGWSLGGRGKEIKEIIDEVKSCVNQPEKLASASHDGYSLSETIPFVIAIVGFGGLGKTTLAQAIFNHELLKESFQIRKWLFVGEKFDGKKLIKDILNEDEKNDNLGEELSDFQNKLIERVKDNKFLIILDDVWSKKSEEWDPLWTPLMHGKKGSVVILTTRDKNVPMTKCHGPLIYELKELSKDECWEIFKQCAFPGSDSTKHPHLKTWGEQIVEKLKGVPLAASMMGGFLGKHLNDEKKWQWVLESTVWPQIADEDVTSHVIGLSYKHLPWQLRSCFGYCSIFPKGHIFDKSSMVQMWVALGFVPPQQGRQLEDVGSDYFEDLHQRSFFQYSDNKYMMHDLVNNFAQEVFKEGCQLVTATIRDCSRSDPIRHLSVLCDFLEQAEIEKLKKLNKLRTLRLKSKVLASRLTVFLTKFKYIRVLELAGNKIEEFPDSIRHMKLLHYLDISQTSIRTLSKAVLNLCNLQTLKVPSISGFAFPEGLSKLVNLRYLEGDNESISEIPGIGNLTLLRRLDLLGIDYPITVVERLDLFYIPEVSPRISELKNMNNLQGKLKIEGLEYVKCRKEAESANLTDKRHLEDLELVWRQGHRQLFDDGIFKCEQDSQSETQESRSDSEVLEGLQLPPHLKRLKIRGNQGSQLPRWMNGLPQLPSTLVSLQLVGCSNWEGLPPLSQLPCLEELVLEDCPKIQCLPEMDALPASLNRLIIHGCPELVGRCQEGGPDHCKIAHIPEVHIKL